MLDSLRDRINKLSKLQRDFIIDHVDGLRPFTDQPVENATREALISRCLIRYEPPARSRLGKPDGTVLTDDGREALAYLLGHYADSVMRGIKQRDVINEDLQFKLLRALTEAAVHWRKYDLKQQSMTIPHIKWRRP